LPLPLDTLAQIIGLKIKQLDLWDYNPITPAAYLLPEEDTIFLSKTSECGAHYACAHELAHWLLGAIEHKTREDFETLTEYMHYFNRIEHRAIALTYELLCPGFLFADISQRYDLINLSMFLRIHPHHVLEYVALHKQHPMTLKMFTRGCKVPSISIARVSIKHTAPSYEHFEHYEEGFSILRLLDERNVIASLHAPKQFLTNNMARELTLGTRQIIEKTWHAKKYLRTTILTTNGIIQIVNPGRIWDQSSENVNVYVLETLCWHNWLPKSLEEAVDYLSICPWLVDKSVNKDDREKEDQKSAKDELNEWLNMIRRAMGLEKENFEYAVTMRLEEPRYTKHNGFGQIMACPWPIMSSLTDDMSEDITEHLMQCTKEEVSECFKYRNEGGAAKYFDETRGDK
jgi:hypothetical protein